MDTVVVYIKKTIASLLAFPRPIPDCASRFALSPVLLLLNANMQCGLAWHVSVEFMFYKRRDNPLRKGLHFYKLRTIEINPPRPEVPHWRLITFEQICRQIEWNWTVRIHFLQRYERTWLFQCFFFVWKTTWRIRKTKCAYRKLLKKYVTSRH